VSFLDLVAKRYSCRRYENKPVPRQAIARCLEAARLAPSACNSQPWQFIVIDTPQIKDKLADAIFSGIYSVCKFAKTAPVLVALVRDKAGYLVKLAGFLRNINYSLLDIGIVGEHFILQAQEEGLGTCWLGWFDEKKAKKILGLPKDTKIDAFISLGYPLDKDFLPLKQRKRLDEIREYR